MTKKETVKETSTKPVFYAEILLLDDSANALRKVVIKTNKTEAELASNAWCRDIYKYSDTEFAPVELDNTEV